MVDLIIKQLTPDLCADYLHFFDHDAFLPGSAWAGCYCYYYHGSPEVDWSTRSACLNRSVITELIQSGHHQGLLAYESGRPIGWCHAAPRQSLPRLTHLLGSHDDQREGVGSILCFIVAPPYRGRGVSRQLLTAACEMFAQQGMTMVEAYPPKGAPRVPHYHGSQALYLEAGFTQVAELEHYVIMQRSLLVENN